MSMGLAFPAGLALLGLAAPLVLLYFLKLRRRAVIVSSTLPWRRVVEDRRANAPWERLRRHLLLLLQLLVLALATLAFAGWYRRGRAVLTQDTVIVLDVSASMGALAGDGSGRTRIELARERIEELLDAVDDRRRAALVLAGPQPLVAAPLDGNARTLRDALAASRLSEAPGRLEPAIRLARTLQGGAAGGDVVVVTDGALDTGSELARWLAGCRIVRVGAAVANAGIVAVALRPVPATASAHELLAAVVSHGDRASSGRLVLTLARDGEEAELASEPLALRPGERLQQLFDVQAQPGAVLRLRLETEGDDALALDDEALLVVPPAPTVRVLLVSPTPFLLSQALAAVPGVVAFTARGLPPDAADHDLIVLEGRWPEVLPRAPLLAFGGRDPAGDGAAGGEHPAILSWDRSHPVLRNVDLRAVLVERSFAATAPAGARTLVESSGGPLVSTWEGAGGRVLAFHFDLLQSDLPLRVAFPVLVRDAVEWLTERGRARAVLPAGRPERLRVGDVGPTLELLPPGGAPPHRLRVRGGAVELPAAERLGLFTLRPPSGGDGATGRRLSVALLSEEESDLSPRLEARAEAPRSGTGSAARDAEAAPTRRFLWPWLLAAALAVLQVEWAVYHRRPT